MTSAKLILASQSKYKEAQLDQLGLSFSCQSPDYEEVFREDLAPDELAVTLARGKAKAVQAAAAYSQDTSLIIIGSDQVAVHQNGQLLAKPGTRDRAFEQLNHASGSTVTFYSAIALLSAGIEQCWHVPTMVKFRQLEAKEIERYIERDQPLDCAGSFKAEALGISLFDEIKSTDPSALIGLPLISLSKALREHGIPVP